LVATLAGGRALRAQGPSQAALVDFKLAAQVQCKALIEFLLRMIADGSQSGAIVTSSSPAYLAWLHRAGKLSIALWS
jgi:hypothetical protein